ncbi:NAD(P)-dependent dehydrogenase, short-chain alcohol dehydrogenase family [Streptomyces mirabilis]|jgi:NAD(P)-dependent dehydrogenase (short-subunit alcohol dehydrogenase family)|uniref:NAD(P)-dependent dehydrogenase, short-chain alcohol dehydrogenase family n=1 Tax=Streptomyces mirabilis TaxID=68239 RepID=A0A1I2Y5Q5_9ACTN|nr:NAD(P)-dependent dehydrogenase, short-chain alcohol dehydrogenase family [Streptomyces mirabilis]
MPGGQALGLVCDVTAEDQVAAAVDRTVETFGRLDMAYNNAGIQIPPADAADESAEIFDKVNAINLRGIWASMKHELRHMRTQGSGAIVNCSSLGGLVGIPGRASYHASKHGVIGLTGSAALQYAPRGIRINAICPGTIDTPMVSDMIAKGELDRAEAEANQPIGRLGTAEEMAQAVLWLCSPGASFVVGVALPVDGGYVAQ